VAAAVALALERKTAQTADAAAVLTVRPARLAALVAKVSTAEMLATVAPSIEVLVEEATAPQEQTAVAQLQTVALAVRTSPQATPAAVVVVLVAVLPELEERAAAVLAATVQRSRAVLERTTWAAAAVVVETAVAQTEPAARAATVL
tara:strand:+ start:646 stop:1086 length:441 start_codon:yes stop_codon:yes gene_type:complete